MINSKCKICRREGQKLFLKGKRCYSPRCSLDKRKYPPGIHGLKGYPKPTSYGLQLREKQKLKRTYGLLERQLKIYFKKASRSTGNVAENILKFLERRLDNIVYRANFTDSRNQAKQLISHGHLLVNQRKVNIPSYLIKKGDEIILKPKSKLIKKVKESILLNKGIRETPSWLEIDETNATIKIIREIEKDDLPKNIEMKLVVEFYSR